LGFGGDGEANANDGLLKDATGTHLYTVHDVHPFQADELAARGVMQAGLTWHFARPPVRDLEYEMDVRGVMREIVL
jgi:hypothetical protein